MATLKPIIPPLTSMAQVNALATSWNQTRDYNTDGEKIPNGGTRVHAARDIYLPPGSPIHLPFDGTIDHWGTSNSDGSTTMGLVCVVNDAQGREWRFVHLAVATAQKHLLPGMPVRTGTLLGSTSAREYLGQRSKSHLHLAVMDKGKALDPTAVLGVAGFNLMTQGVPGVSANDVPKEDATVGGVNVRVVGWMLVGAAVLGLAIYAGRTEAQGRALPA